LKNLCVTEYIKFKRKPDDKLEFLFEYKPADKDLLNKVLDALKGLLGGGS